MAAASGCCRSLAREADIVGINASLAAGAIGPEALASMTPDAVDEKVAIVKLAAGPRFDSLEMNVRAFFVSVTDDREGLAARLAGGFGMTPEAALDTPFALVGTVDQIIETLHERRAWWAFSYVVVGTGDIEPFAPVVAAVEREVTAAPKVAFAGAGWIAAVHGLAVKQLDLPITHVASRHREKAKEMAARMGAVACGYDDLPAGAEIVVVCSAPQCHAEHALNALGRGAFVVIEKPLCTTLADADSLVAAEESGAGIGYAENLAYAPIVQQLLSEIVDIGPLQHLEVRAVQSRPTWGEFLTEEWGGGALFDLGVHPLAIAMLAARSPVVSASAQLEGADDHPTDEHAEVVLTFLSRLKATVVSSWRGGEVPEWSVQAASQHEVVRAELLPAQLLERNGDEIKLPAGHELHPTARAVRVCRSARSLSRCLRGWRTSPDGRGVRARRARHRVRRVRVRGSRWRRGRGPVHRPPRPHAAAAVARRDEPSHVVRRRVVVSGRVQGVWYRDSCRNQAEIWRCPRLGGQPQRRRGRGRARGRTRCRRRAHRVDRVRSSARGGHEGRRDRSLGHR